MCVARFSLAVQRKFAREGEQNADFINCVAFNKTAQVIEKYVNKGTKLAIEGEWRTGSYTNKDGTKVYTNDCNVYSIEFCESRNSQNQQSEQDGSNLPPKPAGDGFINIPDSLDEELPF